MGMYICRNRVIMHLTVNVNVKKHTYVSIEVGLQLSMYITACQCICNYVHMNKSEFLRI